MSPTVNPSTVPMPRGCLGWDGTNFYVLRTDATGHLQIDVLTSALPAGAATLAEQETQTATLELIALIRNALQSVDTDRLIVRGEDQLYSIKEPVAEFRSVAISGADGYGRSVTVPANTIWKITQVCTQDATNAVTEVQFRFWHDGGDYIFANDIRAIGAGEYICTACEIWMDPGDEIRPVFTGGQAGDTIYTIVTGHAITLET